MEKNKDLIKGQEFYNIISCLEFVSKKYPDHIVLSDGNKELSYQELIDRVRRIATALSSLKFRNKPIIVFMDKGVSCVLAMLGVVFSGNFYVVTDTETPANRLRKILNALSPFALITDSLHKEKAEAFAETVPIIMYEEAVSVMMDMKVLTKICNSVIDTDPVYALYTSGSTGQPKGAVVSHRAVLSYTAWFINRFDISEKTVFGSQTPLYFSMSVSDLYSALRTGGRYQMIPKTLFSFPGNLVEYLNQFQVNTLYWVPSALSILVHWDVFSYVKPAYLEKVLFAGEVMHNKELNYWRKFYPDLLYANLFGPTETTDICCYYIVDREFSDQENLPIGRPCENCGIIIVDENGQEADRGELLVRGSFLADGYYNDAKKTSEVFIQNPLNKEYPEKVYRTGDLVFRDRRGELQYLGRKDSQIKHMGYRIEPGEIENVICALDWIKTCACFYDKDRERIVLIYEGTIKEDVLAKSVNRQLPVYMQPGQYVKVQKMPYNANGKIDRTFLINHFLK